MVLVSCRYATLIARIGWRSSQTGFPAACGPWTAGAQNGCSRVVLDTSGCVNFSGSFAIVFQNSVAEVNSAIASCLGRGQGGRISAPNNLEKLTTPQGFIHATYNSDIFGFMDDVYMSTSEQTATDTLVQIQS